MVGLTSGNIDVQQRDVKENALISRHCKINGSKIALDTTIHFQ